MNVTPETFLRCVRAAQGTLVRHARQPLSEPIDIESIAHGLGFQVIRVNSALDEFSGLVSPRHKLIGVNGNHHLHRQRFTVAHELAHIVLDHPSESSCTTDEIAECNIEADVCASELLIPIQLLAHHLFSSKIAAASTLSRLFNVSEEAMARKIQHVEQFRLAAK